MELWKSSMIHHPSQKFCSFVKMKFPRNNILLIFNLYFFLLFSVYANAQTLDSFFVAGTHPSALLQSTTTGKQIMTLFPWKRKLYSGYGDYGANTGPVKIYSFDPDSFKFKYEMDANTDAVYNFRALNGMVYAPAIDRKSYALPGDYIKMDSNGTWANYNFGSNSTHTFDANRLNDSTIFMTGSQNNNAVVWRSINNGRTWSKILTDTPISGTANDFSRFYFGGVLNGKLYVQARDYYGPMHPNSKVYNGTSWTTGSSLFASTGSLGWKPEVFAGKLVYRSWEPGGFSQLRSFDGISNSWTGLYVFDCFIDSNYYYALVDSGYGVKNLRRTRDLVLWENLLRVPNTSRSLAILNDQLFIGTTDSKIRQYTKKVSQLSPPLQIQNSIKNEYSLSIYPNPTYNEFYVKNDSDLPAFLILTDMTGITILKIPITGRVQRINMQGYPKGIYFYQLLSAENKQLNGKIILL